MGLIVFEILFTFVFITFALFLVARKDRYGIALSFVAFSSALATSLMAALYILFYNEFEGQYAAIITKIIFVIFSTVSGTMLYLSMKAPNFNKKILPLIITGVLGILNILLVVLFIKRIGWDALQGFFIDSKANILNLEISGIEFFANINFLATPILSALILFIRARFMQSNIYRQQLRMIALSCLIFAITETGLFWLSQNIFSWIISFLPLGYLVFIILLVYDVSLSVVLDIREIWQAILRFFIFTLSFAAVGGLLVGFFLSYIRNFQLQIFSIATTATFLLFIRQLAISRFAIIFNSSTDYEQKLEKALQFIDYTKGRDEVIASITDAITNIIGASTVDILISDGKNALKIDYSTSGNTGSFRIDTPAFDYLIKQDVQALLQTEVIASYEYSNYKSELNLLFGKTHSDIILFVRDGQRFIAAFALGHRPKKVEYGFYDIEVFKKFYSYFFLVSYYLSNIAKQGIMMAVDREIEMSDQIIDAIQGATGKIENEIIDVGSAEYSAHKLGGDFIDFIELADNKYFFLIGDIAGKGLSASMSMVILKSVLRSYFAHSKDFKDLIAQLNLFIKENLPKGTFFAGLFGILDLKTQTIYYLNCGIPLMSMYIKSYNNAIEIQGEGRVLGFVRRVAPFLKIRKIKMSPQDIIVFTTDGLLDSENLRGDRFGKDRVASILVRENAMAAQELAEEIYTKVKDFVAKELQDDVTILIFKHTGKVIK